jgi:phage baseplate assembly protein W
MPSSYSWPLASPPAPAPVVSADSGAAALLSSGAAGRPRRGLLTPLRRGAADFISGEGAALINSEIRQVLGTRCSSSTTQGELAWRTDFGSLIEHARWKNNDLVLEALLNQWVVDAIARWLKNVRITRTRLERKNDANGQETICSLRIWWEAVSRGGQVLGSGETSVPLPAVARP